jgi:hypothetical protein
VIRIGPQQPSHVIEHKGEFSPSRNRGHLIDTCFRARLI